MMDMAGSYFHKTNDTVQTIDKFASPPKKPSGRNRGVESVKRVAALSQEAPLSILGDFACSHHLLPSALFTPAPHPGFVAFSLTAYRRYPRAEADKQIEFTTAVYTANRITTHSR